ncbi:unnamed protein product [Soboliphyme baturini]|uniref:MFS domain-containing protein n=1 Tax=Soboliphyme baturini TaxID=241478 RepID=A0A183IS39_9BILA|nr:unnamed protein product [Soboliphyme baturini]
MLVFFGAISIYATRVNLSVAIVCMVDADDTRNLKNNSNHAGASTNKTTPPGQQEAVKFQWSKQTSAALLGAFFWGYMCTQVFGGWLSVKIRPTIIILASALCSGVISAVSPLAASISYSLFYACRVILGCAQVEKKTKVIFGGSMSSSITKLTQKYKKY